MNLPDLCQALQESSQRRNGTQTLQFSFATKLLHSRNPQLPIYDSRVASFFFFRVPASDSWKKLADLTAFHEFLTREYARIITSGALATSIATFRQRFNPKQHTDEKIIDWLIWAFVGLIDDGALLRGEIVYR